MALFDFLKRKKEVEKSKKSTEKKVEKVSDVKKNKIEQETLAVKRSAFSIAQGKKEGAFSYDIIKEPHISEKATNLSSNNSYVFKVYQRASKLEIKKSIEGIYKVNVLSVNTVKIPPKKRRLGRTEGFKKGYRKAIITIKEGQKIEIL
jgi:large subunit ribosomal protein L23